MALSIDASQRLDRSTVFSRIRKNGLRGSFLGSLLGEARFPCLPKPFFIVFQCFFDVFLMVFGLLSPENGSIRGLGAAEEALLAAGRGHGGQ